MKKIKLSKKNTISADEFEAKFAKERISIWLDEDLLDELRKIAKQKNKKYQTMINEILRAHVFNPKVKNVSKIINKLESAINDIQGLS